MSAMLPKPEVQNHWGERSANMNDVFLGPVDKKLISTNLLTHGFVSNLPEPE